MCVQFWEDLFHVQVWATGPSPWGLPFFPSCHVSFFSRIFFFSFLAACTVLASLVLLPCKNKATGVNYARILLPSPTNTSATRARPERPAVCRQRRLKTSSARCSTPAHRTEDTKPLFPFFCLFLFSPPTSSCQVLPWKLGQLDCKTQIRMNFHSSALLSPTFANYHWSKNLSFFHCWLLLPLLAPITCSILPLTLDMLLALCCTRLHSALLHCYSWPTPFVYTYFTWFLFSRNTFIENNQSRPVLPVPWTPFRHHSTNPRDKLASQLYRYTWQNQ